MNKELSLRTLAYLVGYYKTHNETIINLEEIEAINFILDENEQLQQENEQLKERNDKAIEYINHVQTFGKSIRIPYVNGIDLLEILRGDSNG